MTVASNWKMEQESQALFNKMNSLRHIKHESNINRTTNINPYTCPKCGTKLISIDLQVTKQLYCAACSDPVCRTGATAVTFDLAQLTLDQNYEKHRRHINISNNHE